MKFKSEIFCFEIKTIKKNVLSEQRDNPESYGEDEAIGTQMHTEKSIVSTSIVFQELHKR
jgi:hypothetical protein